MFMHFSSPPRKRVLHLADQRLLGSQDVSTLHPAFQNSVEAQKVRIITITQLCIQVSRHKRRLP